MFAITFSSHCIFLCLVGHKWEEKDCCFAWTATLHVWKSIRRHQDVWCKTISISIMQNCGCVYTFSGLQTATKMVTYAAILVAMSYRLYTDCFAPFIISAATYTRTDESAGRKRPTEPVKKKKYYFQPQLLTQLPCRRGTKTAQWSSCTRTNATTWNFNLHTLKKLGFFWSQSGALYTIVKLVSWAYAIIWFIGYKLCGWEAHLLEIYCVISDSEVCTKQFLIFNYYIYTLSMCDCDERQSREKLDLCRPVEKKCQGRI